ncbi:MAG: gamma-glutamyl-gamma-aminobutyrate hydrolase family protein [Candidatus Promineifilaceae bacterium]|nr:gamma-glutamyl-gamma-aminobutyrate hydrolase family protein [Candidatus Promineifilaceae bacterium]
MVPFPLIGCTTYHKPVAQTPPIDVYGLMPAYTEAIRAAGGLPVLIPLGLSEEELQGVINRLDGILLPGGGDIEPGCYGGNSGDPLVRDIDCERDRVEIAAVRLAVAAGKPLLAICRGLQMLNVALGGSLWEDIRHHMPNAGDHDHYRRRGRDFLAHEVTVIPNSHLNRALGQERVQVNSLHHQGIRVLAPTLRAVATAPDGLIEAVEVVEHPFAVGVQWHPENLLQNSPVMLGLFRDFVRAAANGAG